MIKYHIYPAASPALPVMLSHKMREVMISPAQENIRSKSGWAMCFGNPDTYRLAPFIASLLGRAYDTCNHDFNQRHRRISLNLNSEAENSLMSIFPSRAALAGLLKWVYPCRAALAELP